MIPPFLNRFHLHPITRIVHQQLKELLNSYIIRFVVTLLVSSIPMIWWYQYIIKSLSTASINRIRPSFIKPLYVCTLVSEPR